MKLKKSAVLGIMLLVSAAVLFTGCGNNSKDTTGEKTPEINYMTKVLDAFSKGDLDSAEEYNSNLPKTVEGLEGRDAVYYKEDYENVLDSEFSSMIEKYAREDNSAAIDIDKDGFLKSLSLTDNRQYITNIKIIEYDHPVVYKYMNSLNIFSNLVYFKQDDVTNNKVFLMFNVSRTTIKKSSVDLALINILGKLICDAVLAM